MLAVFLICFWFSFPGGHWAGCLAAPVESSQGGFPSWLDLSVAQSPCVRYVFSSRHVESANSLKRPRRAPTIPLALVPWEAVRVATGST